MNVKLFCFEKNFTDVCSQGSNWQWTSIGLGDGIIWTNADLLHWFIDAALGGGGGGGGGGLVKSLHRIWRSGVDMFHLLALDIQVRCKTWTRHQMEAFSALPAICAAKFIRFPSIPRTKASDAELLFFSLICVWINGWVNSNEAGDLRRNRAHYDGNIMEWQSSKIVVSVIATWFIFLSLYSYTTFIS